MGRKVCPSNWLLEVGRTACLAAITITITTTNKCKIFAPYDFPQWTLYNTIYSMVIVI